MKKNLLCVLALLISTAVFGQALCSEERQLEQKFDNKVMLHIEPDIKASSSSVIIWEEDFSGGFPQNWSTHTSNTQSGIATCPWSWSTDGTWGYWNGNNDLESEQVKTTQIGLGVRNDIIDMNISLFYRSTKDAIDWQYTEKGEYWTAVNIPEVKVNGHQISADLNIESFPLIGFISKVDLDYTFLDLYHDIGEYRYASNYLTHQFRSSFGYNLFFGISQSWFIRYEDPAQFAARWLTDTVINLPVWRFNTSFSIENIMDVSYQDELGFDASGRWMKFGLKFQY